MASPRPEQGAGHDSQMSAMNSEVHNEMRSPLSTDRDNEKHAEIGTSLSTVTRNPSLLRSSFIILCLNSVAFTSSVNTGLITIGLPYIQNDLHLSNNLLLWPGSIYSLSCACLLLLAGSISDVVGKRKVFVAGTVILGVFSAACGGATNGIQFILFRAMQGIGAAMSFPTAISLITTTFTPGSKSRNFGLASLGIGQTLGFQLGLVLLGVFAKVSVSWRILFYICAGICLGSSILSWLCLPADDPSSRWTWVKLRHEVDWVGILTLSVGLGLLSYVLAVIAGSVTAIYRPENIAILVIACLLLVAFIPWVQYQEQRGKPALIPNSLWRKGPFSAICVMVLLNWGTVQSTDWFYSLFYQKVQGVSALVASLRFIPALIIGLVMSIFTGMFVHRIPTRLLLISTSTLSTASPLLMALINPKWSWWYSAFWAVFLGFISADVLFTVANLIVTDNFPLTSQALAGAVLETVLQLGSSLVLTILAVISSSVTNKSGFADKNSPDALLVGYKAAFWACFAFMVVSTIAPAIGLRGKARVGRRSSE